MHSHWVQLTQLLSLPSHSLLVNPYDSLPPISHSTFEPSTPLTTRLRSLDILLYSLITSISPTLTRELPPWPPHSHVEAKSFRAVLGKSIEALIKAEKTSGTGLEEGVSWRRTFTEEAKGEKWERVLGFLGTLALRSVVRGMGGLKDVQSKGWTSEDVRSTTSRATILYESEVESTNDLLRSRKARLAVLRRRGQQLLSTKAGLSVDAHIIRPDARLDLVHLLALRDDKLDRLPRGVWLTLRHSDPGAVGPGSEMTVRRVQEETSKGQGAVDGAPQKSRSILETHQALLHSLAILSDTPISNAPSSLPLSTPTPSSNDPISSSLTLTLTESLTTPNQDQPPPEFNFTSSSLLPSPYSSLRLPLSLQPSTHEGLSLALLLDSLDPPPSIPPPPPPTKTIPSRLPSLIIPRPMIPVPIPVAIPRVNIKQERTSRDERKTPPRKPILISQQVQDLLTLLGLSPPLSPSLLTD